jgi:hypothetical protein
MKCSPDVASSQTTCIQIIEDSNVIFQGNLVQTTALFVGAQTTSACDKDSFHGDPRHTCIDGVVFNTIMQRVAVESPTEVLMPVSSTCVFLIPHTDITCQAWDRLRFSKCNATVDLGIVLCMRVERWR